MRAAVNQRRQSAIASAKKDDPLPSNAKLHRFFADIASQTRNRPDIGEIIEQIEFSKQSGKWSSERLPPRFRKPMTGARPEPAARRSGARDDRKLICQCRRCLTPLATNANLPFHGCRRLSAGVIKTAGLRCDLWRGTYK
jgi:hypothetical protein